MRKTLIILILVVGVGLLACSSAQSSRELPTPTRDLGGNHSGRLANRRGRTNFTHYHRGTHGKAGIGSAHAATQRYRLLHWRTPCLL